MRPGPISLIPILALALSACPERPPVATEEPPPPAAAPPSKPKPRDPILVVRYTGAAARRLLRLDAGPPEPASDRSASADGGSTADAPPAPEALVELPARRLHAEDPSRPPAGSPWLLPETPSAFVWRHPAPAPGLRLSLVDDAGAAWPSRATTRDDGIWREVVVEPLTPFPPGRALHLVAEQPLGAETRLWREPVAVENGSTEPPPWRQPRARKRGGRRRR